MSTKNELQAYVDKLAKERESHIKHRENLNLG